MIQYLLKPLGPKWMVLKMNGRAKVNDLIEDGLSGGSRLEPKSSF